MQQSSVTDYFKLRKRPQDESSSSKTKLVAAISSKGRDGPSPVRTDSTETDESSNQEKKNEIEINQEEVASGTSNPTKGRKLATPRRQVVSKSKDESGPSTPKETAVSGKPPLPPTKVGSKPNPKGNKITLEQLKAMKAMANKIIVGTAAADKNKNVELTPTKNPPGLNKPISPSKFFSPNHRRDIFSSPVKLYEIQSPSKYILSPSGRSAVKRLFNSTTASPGKSEGCEPPDNKVPAYQRFHHLAQKSEAEIEPGSTEAALPTTPTKPIVEPELPLPLKYKIITELFHAIETIVSILYNRKEMITFEKLRPAVHKLFRRIALQEKHLSQILAIYPNCYNLSVEKMRGSYQLVIGLDSNVIGESMSPSLIIQRRKLFKTNLLNIVLRQHDAFLAKLKPPISIPAGKVVTRWHPQFKLDSLPDIPSAVMPQRPTDNITSAKEMMAKAQTIMDNSNPKMKKALENLLSMTAKVDSKGADGAGCSSAAKEQPKVSNKAQKSVAALKGISQSLIEKIRQREQQRSIQAMTLSPQELRHNAMLDRIPEFVKMLRNMMVAEKKAALPLSLVLDRLSHSMHGSLLIHEVDAHLRLLTSKLPIFANIIKSTSGEYVKIDKGLDINELLEDLKRR